MLWDNTEENLENKPWAHDEGLEFRRFIPGLRCVFAVHVGFP